MSDVSTGYMITDLIDDTDYDVILTATCGGEESEFTFTFTTAKAGMTCEAPIEIDMDDLPYVEEDATTETFGDDYSYTFGDNTTVCNSTSSGWALNGDDIVYEMTPTEDMVVNVTVTPVSSATVGVWVIEGCFGGAEFTCVDYYQGFYSTFSDDNVQLIEVPLIGGTTYRLIISDSFAGMDFDLEIEAVPCPAPYNVVVDSVYGTSADVSFGVSDLADSVTLEWGPAGFEPGTGTMVTIGADLTEYTITGLMTSTNYELYVGTLCGEDPSDAAPAIPFESFCAAVTDYYTGFESIEYDGTFSTSEMPACWTASTTYEFAYVSNFTTSYGGPAVGDQHLVLYNSFQSEANGGFVAAVSPAISNLAGTGNTYRLRFMARRTATFYNSDLAIGVMTDPTDISTYTALDTIVLGYDHQEYTWEDTYDGTAEYIVLRHAMNETYDAISIDEFYWEAIPTCVKPTDFAMVTAIGDQANFSWTASSTPGTYDIVVGEPGFDPDTATNIINVTGTTGSVSGLMGGETYDAYIRTNCGAGDESFWTSTPVTFCVREIIMDYPYTEDFSTGGPNFGGPLPCGWSVVYDLDLPGDTWEYSTTSNLTPGSASLDVTAWPDYINDDWMYSHPLAMEANQAYELTFSYRGGFSNSADVDVYLVDGEGNAEDDSLMTILSLTGDDYEGSTWVDTTVTFFSPVMDTLYLGFHGHSSGTFNNAYIDDLRLEKVTANDIGVAAVTNPMNSCDMGTDTITVRVENFGTFAQSLFFVKYQIDGGAVQTANFSGNLPGQETIEIQFTVGEDFSAEGDYEVTAWTEFLPIITDEQPSNDTLVWTVTHIPTITSLPYFESFENGTGGWSAGSNTGSSEFTLGNTATVIDTASDGTEYWVVAPEGNYTSNTYTTLESPCLDFSSYELDPTLSFDRWMNSETNWDNLIVEYSTDGGAMWSKLGVFGGEGLNWYNDEAGNGPYAYSDGAFVGFDGEWSTSVHPLTGLAGEASVKIRFRFGSDGSVQYANGAGIDNIGILAPASVDVNVISGSASDESVCGSMDNMISIDISNAGLDSLDSIAFIYIVDGGDTIVEQWTGNLASGDSTTYTFTTTVNTAAIEDDFIVEVYAVAPDEEVLYNNGTAFQLFRESTEYLPLVVDWEDGTNVNSYPIANGVGYISGFATQPEDNVYIIWNYSFYADNNIPRFVEFLNTGTVQAGDELSFDYSIEGYSSGGIDLDGDSLIVEISGDCGATWDQVYVVDSTNHTTSDSLTNVVVDLTDYVGGNVKIRFTSIYDNSTFSTYTALDNINIISCDEANAEMVADVTDESLEGVDSNGVAIIDAVLGFSDQLSVAWDNGASGTAVSGLSAGDYVVTITDLLAGCELIDTISVGYVCPSSLEASATTTPESQDMITMDGSITVTQNRGMAPYTYELSGSSMDTNTTGVFTGLANGSYTVMVTDANGCMQEVAVMVEFTCPQSLMLTVGDVENATNAASADGAFVVQAGDGVAPYTFAWSNGETDMNVAELAILDNLDGDATYGVTVTDANGCSDSISQYIMANCPMDLGTTVDAQDATGNSPEWANGSITLTPTGGVAPYSYAWSHDAANTTNEATDLAHGDYEVTITDANGCMEVVKQTLGFITDLPSIPGLESVALTPNPTIGDAVLALQFQAATDVQVSINDITGKQIYNEQFDNVLNRNIPLDLKGQADGVYLVKLQVGTDVQVMRLILQK